ncbi:MAG: hypothetical protein AAF501_04360 [Pseudomonadota bacterium]
MIEIDRRSRRPLRDIVTEDTSGNGARVPDHALSVDIKGISPLKVRAQVLVPIRFGNAKKAVEADIPSKRASYRLGAALATDRLELVS